MLDLNKLLEEITLNKNEGKYINNKKASDYLKLVKMHEYLNIEKERRYNTLKDAEKREVFHVIQHKDGIPEYLTVRDVADFLGVTPQMVRKYCVERKIIAHQRLKGSGKWSIATSQFMNYPNWDEFAQKKFKWGEQSYKIAESPSKYFYKKESD